jgi:hypothetical protein
MPVRPSEPKPDPADGEKQPLAIRLLKIQERFAAYEPTGKKADKAFFDELSGNL